MDEQDILLPEGWKEGDDLFADAPAGQDPGTAPGAESRFPCLHVLYLRNDGKTEGCSS